MKKILQIAVFFCACLISEKYICSGNDLNDNKLSELNNTSHIRNRFYLDSDTISDAKFSIYISQGVLNIKYTSPLELEDGEVVVFNMLGQVITRKKLEISNLNQVPLPIHNTCYIVRISYSGKVYTQKIILTVY